MVLDGDYASLGYADGKLHVYGRGLRWGVSGTLHDILITPASYDVEPLLWRWVFDE
jgi:hypothetical protein